MRKLICRALLVCLVLMPAASALGETAQAHRIDAKTLDFYYDDLDTVAPGTIYFIDGSDVPYLALSDWQDIMANILGSDSEGSEMLDGFEMRFSMEGSTGVLTREDGYTAAFDCDADTLHFLDFDAFQRVSSDSLLTDMVWTAAQSPDEPVRYFLRSQNSYERYGREVTVNAADYGIDFIAQDGECYVPMQTLSDFLLGSFYTSIFWNGEMLAIGPPEMIGRPGQLTPLAKRYYSATPRALSEAMAKFAYGELCMALDHLYGLKASHDIESFDELFDDTGLKPALTGTDPVQADAALYQLFMVHLDDLHTAFRLPSPLSGVDVVDGFKEELGDGQSGLAYDAQAKRYVSARTTAYPDGMPSYEEIGNTAYITLDNFRMPTQDVDYYQTPPTAQAEDTFGIMIYAYSQITREDSPIENVVLDLACNKGGLGNAAIYTMASFLGAGSLSTRNALSGALVTGTYTIDIDLDGRADEKDLGLTDKNLFCLESPLSFSCGNLVPCAFKASGQVSLLGRASGGGACFVQSLSTAYGTCCQISGPVLISFIKNGSFYDTDRGAEPDFPLMNPESFYDRQALTDFINGLR